MTALPQLAPEFEAVLMPHDGITQALGQIKNNQLLSASAAGKILKDPAKYPYAQLTQADGRPYLERKINGIVKRIYMFADRDEPLNPSRMVALMCSVTLNRGVLVILPEQICRGPEADFVMSVRYGCCAGGRTMIYSDTSQSRGVFMNMGSSGGDVRAEIRQMWNRLQAVVLDADGMKALQNLAHEITGRQMANSGHTNAALLNGMSLRMQ